MNATTEKQDLELRRMAANRGLRLVKSRRRNPEAADFGRYGLTDAETKDKIFGFARTRVKASREEIEEFLRTSVQDSWKRSIHKK